MRERPLGAFRAKLRLGGSLKLEVIFAEYGLFYGALLQKRPTNGSHPIFAFGTRPVWSESMCERAIMKKKERGRERDLECLLYLRTLAAASVFKEYVYGERVSEYVF